MVDEVSGRGGYWDVGICCSVSSRHHIFTLRLLYDHSSIIIVYVVCEPVCLGEPSHHHPRPTAYKSRQRHKEGSTHYATPWGVLPLLGWPCSYIIYISRSVRTYSLVYCCILLYIWLTTWRRFALLLFFSKKCHRYCRSSVARTHILRPH